MTSIADLALQRLLDRAENAHGKDAPKRKVNLPFTAAYFKPYWNAPSWTDKSACHAELQLAENAGAIKIVWSIRAGPGNQIDSIELVDGDALAAHIKVTPRWRMVQDAQELLSMYQDNFPVIRDVIRSWSIGKRPKSTGPEDVDDWATAVRVITYCRNAGTVDVPIRRISAALLFDSKRLEALTPILDALLQGDLLLDSREEEDVLNEIGLIKYPPTILVSGPVSISLTGDQVPQLPRHPYIGLAPETISSVRYTQESHPILLTVENLTTFHEMARMNNTQREIVLLYTGGMPSPSFKRVYAEFLAALPDDGAVYHWGDCDLGGFRIADHLAQCCGQMGKALALHQMAPDVNSKNRPFRRPLSSAELKTIAKICERNGWLPELKAMQECGLATEQEGLTIIWPIRPTLHIGH